MTTMVDEYLIRNHNHPDPTVPDPMPLPPTGPPKLGGPSLPPDPQPIPDPPPPPIPRHSRLHKIRGLLAVLLLASGMIVAVAPSAQASVPCPQNALCTYWDTGYGGSMYYYTQPYYQCIHVGAPWTNQISSVFNRTTVLITFYADGNCASNITGQTGLSAFCNCSGDKDSDLGYPPRLWPFQNMNDNIESLRLG